MIGLLWLNFVRYVCKYNGIKENVLYAKNKVNFILTIHIYVYYLKRKIASNTKRILTD